jgi:hypothetical protein
MRARNHALDTARAVLVRPERAQAIIALVDRTRDVWAVRLEGRRRRDSVCKVAERAVARLGDAAGRGS